MIYVDKIRMVEFRGVRDLTINLKGENFAICGKNGTGKSGVVDALEFGLTGNISDRKSTRLNSSHSQISYAVFCLKKKKTGEGEEPEEDAEGSACDLHLIPRVH